MTSSDKPLTPNQWIVAILALAGLCAAAVRFITANPWPFIILGVLVIAISFLLPKPLSSDEFALVLQKGNAMDVITRWDESQIKTAVHTTLVSQGVGAAQTLLSGILSRFVDGQNSQTFAQRTAFVQTQIAYVKTWTELQVSVAEARRTAAKEGQKDKRLGIDDKAIDHDLELSDLRHELEMESVREQIEEMKHKRNNIGKEPPITPPPPPGPTAAERREQQKAALHAREKTVREEIEHAKSDQSLDEELRQRKLNSLYEKLTEIHDALIALL